MSVCACSNQNADAARTVYIVLCHIAEQECLSANPCHQQIFDIMRMCAELCVIQEASVGPMVVAGAAEEAADSSQTATWQLQARFLASAKGAASALYLPSMFCSPSFGSSLLVRPAPAGMCFACSPTNSLSTLGIPHVSQR